MVVRSKRFDGMVRRFIPSTATLSYNPFFKLDGYCTDAFWNLREQVVPEIERAQTGEPRDVSGDRGERVVGEDQCLKPGLLPHGFRHRAEVLLPEIEFDQAGFPG